MGHDKKHIFQRGRDKFEKYKPIITALVKMYSLLPVKVRKKLFEKHRNTRGNIGLAIRYALIKSLAQQCGDNVAIYPGAYIMNPQSMALGNNVSIHPMCYLESGNTSECGILIGNDVSIAHGATIMATTHNYQDKTIPIKDQGGRRAMVTIEDNVWIGAKATILCGITIKTGCVIGANTVVTKNTESEGVYVGMPSKRMKTR